MAAGELAIEATLVPQALRRLGVGYNVNLSKHIIVAAEANYTKYDPGTNFKDGMLYGLSVRYVFGGNSSSNDSKNMFKNLKKR